MISERTKLGKSAMVRSIRAFPSIFKVSFADAVAYRAEFLVWMLSTTMPLIQMALMRAIALEHPIHGTERVYDASALTGYYLATLFVRMLTGVWVVWDMSQEVRTGSFSMRLLRPIHPFLSYASDNLAAMPLRALIALPIVLTLMFAEPGAVTHDWRLWVAGLVATAGAWLLNFLIGCTLGSISFFVESATSVFEVWLALWMVCSGYLFPLDMFPAWSRPVIDVLPFRLMMDRPVRCLTGMATFHEALVGLGAQVLWIAGAFVLMRIVWAFGMKRFSAVGG